MVTDIYGRELSVGNTVVFTSVPHRGHSNRLRTGKIEKISEKGKLTIRIHTNDDLVNSYTSGKTLGNAATGSTVTLNSSNRVIKW